MHTDTRPDTTDATDIELLPSERWPFYADDEVQAVTDLLHSGKVNQLTGPTVYEFQDTYDAYLGQGRSIALAAITLLAPVAQAQFVATTTSNGAGTKGSRAPGCRRRAFSTVQADAMPPASRICDQRKLNQPLRSTSARCPVANWRATASMPKLPLPGTTMAECAA